MSVETHCKKIWGEFLFFLYCRGSERFGGSESMFWLWLPKLHHLESWFWCQMNQKHRFPISHLYIIRFHLQHIELNHKNKNNPTIQQKSSIFNILLKNKIKYHKKLFAKSKQ